MRKTNFSKNFHLEAPWSDSVECSSSWLLANIPKKLNARKEKKVTEEFLRNETKFLKIDTFWPCGADGVQNMMS